MNHSNPGEQLRGLLGTDSAREDEGIERVRNRILDFVAREMLNEEEHVAPLPRRPRRIPRVALVSVLGVLVLGGGAWATGIPERLFPNEQPVPQGIRDFRSLGTPLSAEDLAQVDELNTLPIDNNADESALELAEGQHGRRLGSRSVGYWFVVPSTDGSDACAVYQSSRANEPGLSGTCGMRFQTSGLVVFMSGVGDGPNNPMRHRIAGIAADDVTSVQVELASGGTAEAALANNAFLWVGTSGETPCSLTVHRGESVIDHPVEGPPARGCA